MLKYWFGILAIVAAWILSIGLALSYAGTPPYPIPQAGPNDDLPDNKSLYLKTNITEEAQYDPKANDYVLVRKMGDVELSRRHLTLEEYVKYTSEKAVRDYWKGKADYTPTTSSGLSGLIPGVNLDLSIPSLDKDLVKFDLNGSIGLEFALVGTRRDDPSLDIKHRRTFNFDFTSDINVNLNATIADRLKFNISHNTEALFQFDNKFKLEYAGKEDEIVKVLSAGNIDFPLNTTLITGARELFGIKARLQFGKTFITGVFSEQRSESSNVRVEGGAQSMEFEMKVDDYEENRHFFLAQYFREHYHQALSELPLVNSRVKITKIEVWVTNTGSPVQNNRNIIAFTDLGENRRLAGKNIVGNPSVPVPDQNRSNNLLSVFSVSSLRNLNTAGQYLQGRGYTNGREFEKVESARRLDAGEYSFNASLGFISLNQSLSSDQVLAVAFQYQIVGDTAVYQVGEFSDQGIQDPQVIVVKLLKSSVLNTENTLWDLMMKNVYSLNTYQLSKENFRFNIMYSGNERGVPSGYFTDGPRSGIPLIQVFGVDNLDQRQNKNPDGLFDYIDGAATGAGYVQGDKGLIYLPWPEPFGRDMVEMFGGDSAAAAKYRYDELYRKTKTEAAQYSEKNKYTFVGRYKSSGGSEISLGAYNLPEGSVKVMAGNTPLVENQDYTVNYSAGIVQIINQGVLNSGVPIDIKTESRSNSLLTKRMVGLRVEHFFDEHFHVGGTMMNLRQSALTQKVNYGEEPISNTIYGFDASYDKESRWLTKAVDALLPFQDSKAPSRISLYGEFAHFLPGHSRAIGRAGITYIDDFESSKSTINIKEPYSWYLASTPQKQDDLFPESEDRFASTTITGRNRAKLAWYTVDPIFYSTARPKNITKEDLSNHYTRRILVNEVFPGRQLSSNEAQTLTVLNMAFYPSERGPYNYDAKPVAGVTAGAGKDGNLLNPETRWGGVMRKMNNTDFEAANVEYIEFWMMDPFIGTDGKNGNPRHSGGKLYFNLGDVSEDVLRDGRKSFENGLPVSEVVENVDETQWGRVPSVQAIVNSFDNNPAARKFQDVGLDGLGASDERSFFRTFLEEMGQIVGQNSEAYRKLYEDPSSDNYRYFRRSIWDTVRNSANKIADRYKYYNNPEGNSPSNDDNPESYPTQQTNYPNTEDISEDNTLNEAENYYQYEVLLDPDHMVVGENHITDVYEAGVKLSDNNTEHVKWYQFKIPIKEPDKVVGQMQNLQSVRFVRMFMRGFKDPVILRFASLDLVRSDWRKYNNSLLENGETVPGSDATTFEVATVNVEENGQRVPIRYVLPPGIERTLDPSDQNNVEMNEQSLSLRVHNLKDGDARGIYRNTSYDMRQFKKMEMFVHMEKAEENDVAVDGDIHLFIRLGADNKDNYYEYDIPLTYTEWGQSARELVWPEANKVEIDLGALVKVKENRNRLMREQNQTRTNGVYSEQIGKATYSVKGTPSISAVKTILIGLRNPKTGRPGESDDGNVKSVEVWVNEFSLNEFKKEGGVATTGRTKMSLGDLGNISMSGAYTQANFGQLEQKLTELSQSSTASYDVVVDLEMGRFLPEESGVKMPVHYDLSSTIGNPKYNPLDPDVKTKDELNTYTDSEKKKAFKKAVQDYTMRQNVNLMNVRKERTGSNKEPQFWDIENFNVSYAYSGTQHRDEDMEYDNQSLHRGGFGYDFSTNSKFFVPLGKTKLASNPWAAILTDFNINYVPNMFSFNMEMEREFSESKMRNKNVEWDILMPSTTFKRFDWRRNYNFRYDLTKSIGITYAANANSYLKEPPGRINTPDLRDSVWRSFLQGGTKTNFDQNLGITYTLPINKIPVFDWVDASAAYNAVYRRESASIAMQERLGSVISNSRDFSANGSLNFVELYNKVPFLKKINDGNKRNKRGGRSNTIMSRANQKEEEPEVKSAWKTVYKGAIRFLMMVRDANVNYSRNEGTSLPGFMPEPDLFGLDFDQNAPGIGFSLLGSQADIRRKAASNGWLSTDSLLTSPYHKQFTENLTAQVSVEPFADFRIAVNFGCSKVENHSSYFTYNKALGDFAESNPVLQGSYNVTTLMIGTAFSPFDKKYFDKTYQKFLENRLVIAERLAQDNAKPGYNPNVYVYDTAARRNYPQGYMSNNQDVMLPALLAAYMGIDPGSVSLSSMDKFPMPNWSLTYSGLTKIKGVRKVFKNFSISHAYSSSYTIGSFTNNLLYRDAEDFVQNIDAGGNFRSQYIMDGIVLSEQFSPLIKLSMTLANDLSFNFEYRQSRQIGLSFVNNQITEMRTKEWIVGAGYRIKNVSFKVNSGGSGKRRVSSDVVLRADFSVRDNIRLLRKIDQLINTPSEGALITSINLYAEYEITRQLAARVFYDMTLNKPYIANQFYNSNGRGGVRLTYKFTQ